MKNNNTTTATAMIRLGRLWMATHAHDAEPVVRVYRGNGQTAHDDDPLVLANEPIGQSTQLVVESSEYEPDGQAEQARWLVLQVEYPGEHF